MTEKPIYVVEGNNFSDFAGFIEEFNEAYVRHVGGEWHGNLDAFFDYLNWAGEPFVLVWRNSAKSRVDLGYSEMAKWLVENMKRCHPSNIPVREKELSQARSNEGRTLFDWLVEIIREEPAVELRME